MKIVRDIGIYYKQDGKLFYEIDITHLSIEIIANNFYSLQDDPNFYRPYKINKKQFIDLKKYIPQLKDYSLNSFDMFIEAYSIT